MASSADPPQDQESRGRHLATYLAKSFDRHLLGSSDHKTTAVKGTRHRRYY
jgi:hypothetical protein